MKRLGRLGSAATELRLYASCYEMGAILVVRWHYLVSATALRLLISGIGRNQTLTKLHLSSVAALSGQASG